MTPEQSDALAAASAALTARIQALQRAIEARDETPKLQRQLDEARSLHEALTDVLTKVPGMDPRAIEACAQLGGLLDGLQRTMEIGGSQ
jgi:hypothetical protein